MPQVKALKNDLVHFCNVEFAFVYIAEAHAADEWPVQSSRYNDDRGVVDIKQHRTTKERQKAAFTFREDFGLDWCPFYIDIVPTLGDTEESRDAEENPFRSDGDFERFFAPWPTRFYVLHKGKVVFMSYPKNSTYHVGPLRRFLVEELVCVEAFDC